MTNEPSVTRRLTIGMSGQAFFRLAAMASSVTMVPLLIHAWGVAGYGEWIALTAVASYLGYANFGLVTTASYEMMMAVGAGDQARARRSFEMSINMIFWVIAPVIAVCTAALCMVPGRSVLNLSTLTVTDVRLVLIAMGAQIWLKTLRSQMAATLAAAGRYGVAYYVSGVETLLEVAVTAACVLLLDGGQPAAAFAIACCTAAELLVVTILAIIKAPWARPRITRIDGGWLRDHVKPLTGYLVGGLAVQGVSVQGPRVALAATLGGSAVATFSVYGALMRMVDQLALMFVLPGGVEISRRVGAKDFNGAYRLIIFGTRLSLFIYVVVCAMIVALGPVIFDIWTRGKLEFSYLVALLYIVLSGASYIGKVSWYALTSANRLYGVSFGQLACTLGGVLLGAYLVTRLGLAGMIVGCALGELMNSLLIIAVMSRWLRQPMRKTMLEMANVAALADDWRLLEPRLRSWFQKRRRPGRRVRPR